MTTHEVEKPKAVLIVEDDPDQQRLCTLALKRDRPTTEVLTVNRGEDALRILDQRPIDAVVVDFSLPDMDGLKLLSQINLRAHPPPTVMVTAWSDTAVAVEAMRRGAMDYVVKGADHFRKLSIVIDRAMETAALHERVRTSERQFRDLLDASTDAICVLSRDAFAYVNQRFSEIFGWSVDELVDSDLEWQSLLYPGQADLKKPGHYEITCFKRSGVRFIAEVSVSSIRFHGQPATLGILRDISSRKVAEDALVQRNRELSALREIVDSMTRVRDLPSLLKDVAERMIELLGVDAAGVGLYDASISRLSAVHFVGASDEWREAMLADGAQEDVLSMALRAKGLAVVREISWLDSPSSVKEGFRSAIAMALTRPGAAEGVIAMFTRAPRTFADEDVALFVAVARQVTVVLDNARLYQRTQESVERLRALSEIARAISSTLDVEGVFRVVGERLQRIVPYRRVLLKILKPDYSSFLVRAIDRSEATDTTKVRVLEPVRTKDSASFLAAIETKRPVIVERPTALDGSTGDVMRSSTGDFFRTGDVVRTGDLIKTADDLTFVEGVRRYAIVPIIADDMPMGALAVGTGGTEPFRQQDIELLEDLAAHMGIALKNARMFEDRERAFNELKDTRDRLVRSERLEALGQMAAGVAHEFNNLLSAILGRAQMLKVMASDPELLRSIGVIEQAAIDGAGTVRRIQEFAKAKSDQPLLPVHINPLVRDTAELTMTRVRGDGQGPKVDVELDLSESGQAMGNAAELRQVLTNLVYNAVDAMPGGGRLIIRTGREAAGAGRVWFEVEDTGLGMDRETQDKMFIPFFTTKGKRGTGLGLSVSYTIVEHHGGEFEVASEKGKGTRIRVLLPAAATSAPEQPAVAPSEPAAGTTEGRSRHARILVIDDDTAVRDVLSDILRTGDHQVVSVDNGAEGLELFKRSAFDLVFTDLGMPGMNGWEVAAGIKSLSPATPVGLITGWGATIDEARLKDRGVDLIVSKPFRYHQVLELVSEAMELKGTHA